MVGDRAPRDQLRMRGGVLFLADDHAGRHTRKVHPRWACVAYLLSVCAAAPGGYTLRFVPFGFESEE